MAVGKKVINCGLLVAVAGKGTYVGAMGQSSNRYSERMIELITSPTWTYRLPGEFVSDNHPFPVNFDHTSGLKLRQ